MPGSSLRSRNGRAPAGAVWAAVLLDEAKLQRTRVREVLPRAASAGI